MPAPQRRKKRQFTYDFLIRAPCRTTHYYLLSHTATLGDPCAWFTVEERIHFANGCARRRYPLSPCLTSLLLEPLFLHLPSRVHTFLRRPECLPRFRGIVAPGLHFTRLLFFFFDKSLNKTRQTAHPRQRTGNVSARACALSSSRSAGLSVCLASTARFRFVPYTRT